MIIPSSNPIQSPSPLTHLITGLFPRDNARDTRFAINFFTSVGLGGLTDGLREYLKNAPKLLAQQMQAQLLQVSDYPHFHILPLFSRLTIIPTPLINVSSRIFTPFHTAILLYTCPLVYIYPFLYLPSPSYIYHTLFRTHTLIYLSYPFSYTHPHISILPIFVHSNNR